MARLDNHHEVQAILANDCPSTLALLCYYILYLYREKYHD